MYELRVRRRMVNSCSREWLGDLAGGCVRDLADECLRELAGEWLGELAGEW